jgi:hypothetical protein
MASGQSDDAQNRVNPYAASAIVEPHVDSEELPARPLSPAVPRTYRIEMQWADRRRFLRTVGLLRFFAAAGAAFGVYGLYGLVTVAYSSLQSEGLSTWLQLRSAGGWLLLLAKSALVFYTCWLQWSLADAIAATAGGTTGRMENWSLIQQRIALMAIVVLAVGVFSLAWDWLTIQFMFSSIRR